MRVMAEIIRGHNELKTCTHIRRDTRQRSICCLHISTVCLLSEQKMHIITQTMAVKVVACMYSSVTLRGMTNNCEFVEGTFT